ncbi:MAG: shikimate kinase [Clostridium sp.]|nr:shikimate kinase [Prevotella sp.]MCM1428552.1 shikimate kinase [Clostridium sp.]MCM1475016.1 shikimate kinase [Muribaculaceae bacterium]
MASGKTTFGRALARRLGYDFIDLDFYIEQRFRSKIREIFATRGEAEFRRMESRMLREVGEFEDVVIACGGGTPCISGNMEYMNSRGLTVCLEASVGRIVERLQRAPGKRPLAVGKTAEELTGYVRAHMQERKPWYDKAKIRFQGENLEDSLQIEGSVEEFLKRTPELL